MIFVTVGSTHFPFARLVGALGALPLEELVVQHGPVPPPAGAAGSAAFMPFGEVLEHLEAADVVVTHAGVGSVLCARRIGHTPVVVPRLKRHREAVDDHQVELTRALEKQSAAIPVWDVEALAAAVAAAPPRRAPAERAEAPIHAAVRAALKGAARKSAGA